MNPETKRHEEALKALEVLQYPEIRISAAVFARVKDEYGRFALLINQDRKNKGEFVLTPIGGAITAVGEELDSLKNNLGIRDQVFESGNDLRFRMKGSASNVFREWFLTRTKGSLDLQREVAEELTKEAEILSPTDAENLLETNYIFSGYGIELAKTSRSGQEGVLTLRVAEIFDVNFVEPVMAKLQEESLREEGCIKFVTEEEIISGKTKEGIVIGEISKVIIEPLETIETFR